MSDLRIALRQITKQRWSSAAIVLTLALAMSAAAAVYAVFNHVMFRPIPGVQDPATLATVYFQPADRQPTFSAVPRGALASLRTVGVFSALGAAVDAELAVLPQLNGDAELVRAEFVTDQYFEALGVRPRAGRMFVEDDFASRHSVAIVSEAWCRRVFGGEAAALGRTISLNRLPVVIIGVVTDYRGWGAVQFGTTDIWMPIDAPVADAAAVPTDDLLNMVGRLRPGLSVPNVEQQLRAPFAPFASAAAIRMAVGTLSEHPPVPVVYAGLYEINQERTRATILATYPLALASAGLLLLLGCANASNLLLAQRVKRAGELAVRSALGASRWRLARGQLVEAAALVLVAVGTALLLARGSLALVQGERLFSGVPALDAVHLDWRVMAFVGAVSTLTIVLFGLLPALAVSRRPTVGPATISSRATPSSKRLRVGLVGVQLALAVTLLSGAGVLVRTLQNLRGMDLGANPDHVVSFAIVPMQLGYSSQSGDDLVQRIRDRLKIAPGVEAAATATPPPFGRLRRAATIRTVPGAEGANHEVTATAVSSDYFRTLQIPLRAGRWFTDGDPERGRLSVGIINESLARQLFGDASTAVGRHLYLSRSARRWRLDSTIEIVGIVADTRFGGDLRAAAPPALYEPGSTAGGIAFFVRSQLSNADAVAAVREAVRDVDPMLPVANAGSLRDVVDQLIPEERVLALLVTGVAIVALLLGVGGVYAVIAHTTAERTREFAIRIALGAPVGRMVFGVVRGVAVIAGISVCVGLATFAAAARMLDSRVYGVAALDPMTLVAVSVLLVFAALSAGWLPARSATQANPAATLRLE